MMLRILLVVSLAVLALIPAVPAFAGDDDDRLRAVPAVFVGNEGDCGTLKVGNVTIPYPAGSNIVTAAWLRGMGLPDRDGDTALNTSAADLVTNPNKRDPHTGFLMSKNGPTADCSASGAEIKGFRKSLTAPITLGFDYRNGSHCGAGAPRFNVVARPATGPDTFHFVGGCANDTPAPAPQDPLQWTRVRFNTSNAAQSFPVIPAGSRIISIDLIFDEGTDSTSVPDDPRGIGLAVVDNIDINGRFIRSGRGIEPSPDDDNRGDHD